MSVLTPDQLLPRNGSHCLRFAVEIWFPHLIWVSTSPRLITGSMIEISRIIAKQLNKSCTEYVWSADGTFFGVRHDNGSWDGLMGLVARNVVDMSGVPVTIEHSRLEVVDFSSTLYVDGWNLAYKRPELQSDISGFVKPFTMLLWSLIAAIMIAVCAGLFFVEYRHKKLRSSKRYGDQTTGSQKEEFGTALWNSLLWTISAPITQACKWRPSGDSVRLLSGLWLLMALIISTLYRSNLKAMLILPKIVLPFNNIQELVGSGIPLHLSPGSTISRLVQNSLPGTSMYALKNYNNIISSTNALEVLSNTIKGHNAVFTETFSILFGMHSTFAARRKCELYLGEEHFSSTVGQSLALPKGSPYKNQIDFIILHLREAGIFDHHLYKQVKYGTLCLKMDLIPADTTLRPMDLESFYGVFSIYAGGIALASLAFLIESAMDFYQRRLH